MSAPPPRRPASQQRLPGRVFGLIGVVGLFVIAIVAASMISSASDDSSDGVKSSPTPTLDLSTPTPTPKPKPTPVPLTTAQKAERNTAIQLVLSKDFKVVRKADWNPDATLKVLIGRSTSGSEFAFFFEGGQYLGNDSTDTSHQITVKKSSGSQVTLRYGIYAAGDPPDAPSGKPFDVIFTYVAGTVSGDQDLPPASERNPS